MIYLYYAANTPTDERVLQTFCDMNQSFFGNPNAHHSLGFAANEKMEQITDNIAKLLSVKANEIIYTSGATEANNTAIKGIAKSSRHVGKHIISSFMEHSSVSGTLTFLQEQGYEIELVNILPDGTIDLPDLMSLLREDTILVTTCAVESEIGIQQPLKEIADILKGYPNCKFHVDATQAIGKVPFDFSCGDTISFAPHKFFGLNGCGVLIKKENLVIDPLLHGGASTTIYRSGTPALAFAASIEKALSIAKEEEKSRYQYVTELQDFLIEKLKQKAYIKINNTNQSIPHFINISTIDIRAEQMQKRLDSHGVCISIKSACSVANTPSRPVFAVTRDKKNARRSFRISISHLTTKQEIETFLEILDLSYKEEKNL